MQWLRNQWDDKELGTFDYVSHFTSNMKLFITRATKYNLTFSLILIIHFTEI